MQPIQKPFMPVCIVCAAFMLSDLVEVEEVDMAADWCLHHHKHKRRWKAFKLPLNYSVRPTERLYILFA